MKTKKLIEPTIKDVRAWFVSTFGTAYARRVWEMYNDKAGNTNRRIKIGTQLDHDQQASLEKFLSKKYPAHTIVVGSHLTNRIYSRHRGRSCVVTVIHCYRDDEKYRILHPDPIEITFADIAERFNCDPRQIKIVDRK